jgi:hypothetical protein
MRRSAPKSRFTPSDPGEAFCLRHALGLGYRKTTTISPKSRSTNMITYLVTQLDRMNEDQQKLVERMAKIPEPSWHKKEREWLSLLYLWLHMDSGSVAKRKFPSKANSH